MPRSRRSRTKRRRSSSIYSCAGKNQLECNLNPLCSYESSLVVSKGRSPYMRNQCKSAFSPSSLTGFAAPYASALSAVSTAAAQQKQLRQTASINALNALIAQSSQPGGAAAVEKGLLDAARTGAAKVAQLGMPKKAHTVKHIASPSAQLQASLGVPSLGGVRPNFNESVSRALAYHVGKSAQNSALQQISQQASTSAAKLTPSMQLQQALLQGYGSGDYAAAAQLALLQGKGPKSMQKYIKAAQQQAMLQQLSPGELAPCALYPATLNNNLCSLMPHCQRRKRKGKAAECVTKPYTQLIPGFMGLR